MNIPNISNISIHELNDDNIRHYASFLSNSVPLSKYSQYVTNEVQDRPKIEEITMEVILGMKYRKGKVQYLVKWETIDETEWIEADKCDKQLIKEYLDKNEKSAKEARSKSILTKKENNRKSYDFEKVVCKDDCGDSKKDTHTRNTKLYKGDWEDQVEEVESMFKHVATGEWYSLLKWKNGYRSAHPNKEANIKCPQKMIYFYESRIVFGKKPIK